MGREKSVDDETETQVDDDTIQNDEEPVEDDQEQDDGTEDNPSDPPAEAPEEQPGAA